MLSHTRNPFDRRLPANPSTEGFLRKLEGSEAADAYRKAMGEEGSPSITDDSTPEPTPEDLVQLRAIQDRERDRELVELRKRQYLAWAQEFNLGGDDPQEWIDETFTFNPDGTVEAVGNLELAGISITRLPGQLTRVNGLLNLARNHLTSLKNLGLPKEVQGGLGLVLNDLTSVDGLSAEIHEGLNLSMNHKLVSLEGLRGKKIYGDLWLGTIPAIDIPDGIELHGKVRVEALQTVLAASARAKGYEVRIG